jgi:hypothetical protein
MVQGFVVSIKVELIVSIGLIGVGFATDGAWLDVAEKLASVISCVVTCIAFNFAWKACHYKVTSHTRCKKKQTEFSRSMLGSRKIE